MNADAAAFVELMDPDVELYLPRSAIEGTVYRGLDGAAHAFADGFDSWERVELLGPWSVERTLGDWHLGRAPVRLIARADVPTVEFEGWWLFRLANGKIAYAHPYQDATEAHAAFDERAVVSR